MYIERYSNWCCFRFRIRTYLQLFILIQFLLTTQIEAQSRKDLIWEYKKLIRNDSHLGISLTGKVNNYSNAEISATLDSAWIRKENIVLLQILGYLPNPACVIAKFSNRTISDALSSFRDDYSISHDLNDDKSMRRQLTECYLNSSNPAHLSYLVETNILTYDSLDILLIAYKNELELQLWVKTQHAHSKYTYLKSYQITDTIVANPGPKSRRGDYLTPEGFYSVDFYPSLKWSDFYLAFRVNYPNDADSARRRRWGISGKAGGDINIHGCCVSIGCIPIGNPDMEELFLLTRANQENGSSAHILIFPYKFDDRTTKDRFNNQYRDEILLLGFWQSLERIHQYFLESDQLPRIYIDHNTGNYKIN